MKKYLFAILGLALILLVVRLSAFIVDAREYVYVTQLGRHVATFDGGDAVNDAGLHWGWPWPITSVVRLDRRLQYVDLPVTEVVTHDREGNQEDRLLVEGYVCWRIAGKEHVDRFVRRLGTIEDAEVDIGQKLNSHLSGLIQQKSTKDLINTQATIVSDTMSQIRDDLMSKLGPVLLEEYGVELVDVRLRRFSYHPQVRNEIFERIRSERNKKAEEFRSKGNKVAADIRSKAEEEANRILADARKKEKILKGQGEIEATKIRNEAHSRDPEFYAFLKKLETLQSILSGDRAVLLLSSHREIFELLFRPPGEPLTGNGRATSQKKEKPPRNGPVGGGR